MGTCWWRRVTFSDIVVKEKAMAWSISPRRVDCGCRSYCFEPELSYLRNRQDRSRRIVFALKSVRTGLIIGTLTTLIVTPFAILCGILAGYVGGWIDDIIQYVYSTLDSIPEILLIAAAMLIFQVGLREEETIISADKRLIYLCVIMGITSWTGLCRLIRAEVLKLREIEYVQAADAFGVSRGRIMLQHLVPNVMQSS